ncbi:MAG: hypothetical protein LBB74_05070, partial [Chitinispirillales bacterium]|nr:hypothetical protein [Chitinispirillales bacterium]
QAKKDHEVLTKNGFAPKLAEFLDVVERDPYEDTPGHHYEELLSNLKGIHSRRINRSNQFTYEVLPNGRFGGYWWTATEYSRGSAYIRGMGYYGGYVGMDNHYKEFASSVRCVRDGN